LNILATSLNVPHNYLDDQTKIFSDLYLAKFSDTSVKSFFSINMNKQLFSFEKMHVFNASTYRFNYASMKLKKKENYLILQRKKYLVFT